MNFNNLPTAIHELIFTAARLSKIDAWYNHLDKDDQDDIDMTICDMYLITGEFAVGELPIDLDYLESTSVADWSGLELDHKKYFYDRYKQHKVYDAWYDKLEEEKWENGCLEQDELDDTISDMFYGVDEFADGDLPLDLSYFTDSHGYSEVSWFMLRLNHKKWFYDMYWKAHNYNSQIMSDGNPY